MTEGHKGGGGADYRLRVNFFAIGIYFYSYPLNIIEKMLRSPPPLLTLRVRTAPPHLRRETMLLHRYKSIA